MTYCSCCGTETSRQGARLLIPNGQAEHAVFSLCQGCDTKLRTYQHIMSDFPKATKPALYITEQTNEGHAVVKYMAAVDARTFISVLQSDNMHTPKK